MLKCDGCDQEAKYLVYEHQEPHCLECLLDAIECNALVEVRWIEDATWHPNQSQ